MKRTLYKSIFHAEMNLVDFKIEFDRTGRPYCIKFATDLDGELLMCKINCIHYYMRFRPPNMFGKQNIFFAQSK